MSNSELISAGITHAIADSRKVEARLRDHFKATTATVDNDPDETTLRMEFHGFNGFQPALEKVSNIAHQLETQASVNSVHCGVDTSGGYRSSWPGRDDRPRGWVNAVFDPEKLSQRDRCTCGENEACDACPE